LGTVVSEGRTLKVETLRDDLIASDLHHDLTAASQEVVSLATREFRCDNSVLFSFNPATGAFLSPPVVSGHFLHPEMAFAPPRPSGITRAVRERGALLIPDLQKEPQYSSPFSEREAVRAFMAVTIATPQRTHPFAVVFLNYRAARKKFTKSELNAVTLFAERMAAPLHEAWSFVRYKNVIGIGKAINENLGTVEELFARLEDQLSNTINTSHWFGLGVVSPGRDTLDLHYRTAGKAYVGHDLALNASCREAILADRVRQPVDGELEGLSLPIDVMAQSTIFAPLTLREAPLGFLLIQHPEPNAYDAEDLHVVEILANHVSTALNGIDVFRALDTLRTVGELLTGQIRDDDAGRRVAGEIKKTTEADLVCLYSYHEEDHLFEGEPLVVGELLQSDVPIPSTFEPGDIPNSTVAAAEAQFADDASELSMLLRGTRAESPFQQRERIASVAAVPLRVAGETVGALLVNFRQPQRFSAVQKRLIRGLGVFSAIALKNARLYSQRGQRRTAELGIIRAIDRSLNKSRSLKEMLDTIVVGANEVIHADRASLLIASPDRKLLRVEASMSQAGVHPHQAGVSLPTESAQGITVYAYRHHATVRINDIYRDSTWRSIVIDTHDGMRSELDVPLIDEGLCVGVLNFESRKVPAFTPEHEEFGEILAGQVVLAVSKAQDYEQTQRRVGELERLNEFTAAIVGELDAMALLQRTLAHAVTATEASCGVLFLAGDKELHPAFVEGIEGPHPDVERGNGVIGRVTDMTKVLLTRPTHDATAQEAVYLKGARYAAITPLRDGDHLRGVVLVSWHDPRTFDPTRRRVLETIVQTASIALQSADRLREAVEQQEHLSALLELARAVADESDTVSVLETIVTKALERTNATRADLDLYDAEEAVLKSYRCERESESDRVALKVWNVDYTEPESPAPDRGIVSWVAEHKEPFTFLGDVQTDHRYRGSPSIHSEIAVPLTQGGRFVGVLNVESTQKGAFTQGHIQLLLLFAAEAVSHMRIANSRANERRQLKRFAALRDMGESLGELSHEQRIEAFKTIVQRAATECDCFAVVRQYDPATKEFVLVATAGEGMPPFERIPYTDSVYQLVLRDMDAVNFPDLEKQPLDEPISVSDLRVRSLMVAPVHAGGEILGSIGMSHLRSHHFSSPDMELIKGLAKLLAVTLVRMGSATRETQLLVHEKELLEQNAQAQLMSSMGDAAIYLAHRLGSDLGRIKSYLNFARDALDNNARLSAEEQFQMVETAAAKVLKYSEQLKDYVSKRSEGPPSNVDLTHILQDISGIATPPQGYRVDNGIAEPMIVYARPADLRMIFENLTDNAYEAMAGHGNISIRATRCDRTVEVEFWDDGPGVPSKYRDFIFKFGFSTKRGGTGWGLWKAQATARFNGGDLSLAESERGARFRVKLREAQTEAQDAQ
jgi:GAF domain-containing protein